MRIKLSQYVSNIAQICTVFCLLAVTPFLSAQSPEGTNISKKSLSHGQIAKIQNRGVLIVAMNKNDQPPFFMVDRKGELIGYEVELAKKMAESLGVRVKFDRSPASFNDVVRNVAQGKADVGISKLSRTLVRAQKVFFSKPYMMLNKTFLINRILLAEAKSERKAETLNKLFNHRDGEIGVIANSSYENYAKILFPNSTTRPLESWGIEALQLVIEGKILAIFRDNLEINKLIRMVPEANLSVMPVTLEGEEDRICMAIPAHAVHFKDWINDFIDTQETNLKVVDLLNKYQFFFDEQRKLLKEAQAEVVTR